MRTKYVTYAEASEAAQRLGFKTKAEYQNGCKQDPKLPFSPNQVYAEDWGGWYVFLGTKRPEEKYATYAEAAEAAQRLGFKTMAEFQKGYKRDPKLPFHPERFYGGG